MGFHTSFHLAYPTDPGVLTGATIKGLIEQLLPHCREGSTFRSIGVAYGDRPSSSDRSAAYQVPTEIPGLSLAGFRWDFQSWPKSTGELLGALTGFEEKNIHRALVAFGALTDEVAARLKREPGPENEIGLYPYDISILIEPIEVEPDDEDDEPVQVGWVAISISGSGYCYPWTQQELIDRCLDTELCHQARRALTLAFGPPKSGSNSVELARCNKRARLLSDGLIAAVQGI